MQHVDATGMGRTAAKAEIQDEEVAALHRALLQVQSFDGRYGGGSSGARTSEPERRDGNEVEQRFSEMVVGTTDGLPYVAARPLVADRIVFGAPPKFDPLPYLDHRTAAMYEHPEQHHRQYPEDPPRVSVRATSEEKVKLYRKMTECGRLTFLRCGEVEPAYASGLFGVVKDLSRDRLIMDSRPANGREQGLNHWCGCLANAALLGGTELEPYEDLRLSGQDIKDLFYQFVVGHPRACRNALVGKLTAAEARAIFGDSLSIPPEGGYAGLSTMAMGDLCAVEFAQAAHISVMLHCKALHPSELLRGKSVMPRGPFMLGLVIDDLVMLEKVVRGTVETIADQRMPLAVAKYWSSY